jgi:hypothetical protein
MKKTILKGSCLARRLETQASDSTGFRYSLKQFVEYLDESKTAYHRWDSSFCVTLYIIIQHITNYQSILVYIMFYNFIIYMADLYVNNSLSSKSGRFVTSLT